MTEAQLQSKMINYLKDKKYFVIKTVRTNMKGIPDLIVCAKGKFYGIEVKREGKKETGVTELQKHQINLINESGGIAFVADSIKDLKDKGL